MHGAWLLGGAGTLSAQFGTVERSSCLGLDQYFARVNDGSTESIQCQIGVSFPHCSFPWYSLSHHFKYFHNMWRRCSALLWQSQYLDAGELRGVPGCSSLLQGALGGQESGFYQQCASNSNCKSSICGVQESGSSPMLVFYLCQSLSNRCRTS